MSLLDQMYRMNFSSSSAQSTDILALDQKPDAQKATGTVGNGSSARAVSGKSAATDVPERESRTDTSLLFSESIVALSRFSASLGKCSTLRDRGKRIVETYYPEFGSVCCIRSNYCTSDLSQRREIAEIDNRLNTNFLSATTNRFTADFNEIPTTTFSAPVCAIVPHKTLQNTSAVVRDGFSTELPTTSRPKFATPSIIPWRDFPSKPRPVAAINSSADFETDSELLFQAEGQSSGTNYPLTSRNIRPSREENSVQRHNFGREQAFVAVMTMIKEQCVDSFVLHNFQYNAENHDNPVYCDPGLADSIKRHLATPAEEELTSLEIDFIIFSIKKGVFVGEVKSVANNAKPKSAISRAKRQLRRMSLLLEAVLSTCKLPNVKPRMIVFLPNLANNFQEKSSDEFIYVRGVRSNWWRRIPDTTELLNLEFFYKLVGLSSHTKEPHRRSDSVDESSSRHLRVEASLKKSHSDLKLLKKVTITPDQSKVWKCRNSLVLIMGPPGSGKSLLLESKAMQMAARNEPVLLVVSEKLKLRCWNNETRYRIVIQYGTIAMRNFRICSHDEFLPTITQYSQGPHLFLDDACVFLSRILDRQTTAFNFIRHVFRDRQYMKDRFLTWLASDSIETISTILSSFSTMNDLKLNSRTNFSQTSWLVLPLKDFLHCAPSILSSWEHLYEVDLIATNDTSASYQNVFCHRARYGGGPLQLNDFFDFVVDILQHERQNVISWSKSKDIAFLVADENRNEITNLLKQRATETFDVENLFRPVTEEELVSAQYEFVVMIDYCAYDNSKDAERRNIVPAKQMRNDYFMRSRAIRRLLIIKSVGDGPRQLCLYPGMRRLITATLGHLSFRYDELLKFRQIELDPLYREELDVFWLEKIPDLLSFINIAEETDDAAAIANIPWSLPSIAVHHINMVLSYMQIPHVGQLLLEEAFKQNATSSVAEKQREYPTGMFAINKPPVDDEQIKKYLRAVTKDNATITPLIAEVRLDKLLEKIQDNQSSTPGQSGNIYNEDFYNEVLEKLLDCQSTAERSSSKMIRELASYINKQLEQSSLCQRLRFRASLHQCESEHFYKSVALNIVTETIQLLLYSAAELLEYHPRYSTDALERTPLHPS